MKTIDMVVNAINRTCFLQEGENGDFVSATLLMQKGTVRLNASVAFNLAECTIKETDRVSENGAKIFELISSPDWASVGSVLAVKATDLELGYFAISRKVNNLAPDVLALFAEETVLAE